MTLHLAALKCAITERPVERPDPKPPYAGPLMAAFHKSVFSRMVRDLEARLAVDDFEHGVCILFCPARVEAHLDLVARKAGETEVTSRKSWFASRDSIRTAVSRNHAPSGFAESIAAAGWATVRNWTTPDFARTLRLLRTACELPH